MNDHTDTKYIIVVGGFKDSLFDTLAKLRQEFPEYRDARFLLLANNTEGIEPGEDLAIEETDFSSSQLKTIMEKYANTAIAVLCRGDKYVQYLRKLIPYLPSEVRVASEASLEIATNKRLMRHHFQAMYPEISPAYMSVADASAQTLSEIESHVGYPAIIKPASLASSILIQRVDNRQELEQALPGIIAEVASVYVREGRSEKPEIIIEEFLEGDFYSIDSYVLGSNDFGHLPVVGYLPAASMGIDDFFLYKRWAPVDLSAEEVREAQLAVEKAVESIGLTWSSTHTELIKTARGWRVIEVGPRIGRFRNTMYAGAYGIDHGYNDLLIHLGKRPVTKNEKAEFAVAYSIYPTREGTLRAIAGLDTLEEISSYVAYQMLNADKIGHPVHFAKNGGHALLEVILFAPDRETMTYLSSKFESNVKAEVV